MKSKKANYKTVLTVVFSIISVLYVFPIVLVIINSFKKKTSINLRPFELPTEKSFVGLDNYINGIEKVEFFKYFGYSLFITAASVIAILLFCSMCGWYVTRVKNAFTKALKSAAIFSMVVPFQMIMFTLAKTADTLHLNTPVGIVVVYLGFGAGMAIFMFSNFAQSMPIEIEEAANIDGCNPLQMYFKVILPIMKPTYVSVGILEIMWIWNDYLLPYLVLDIKKYKTIPIVIQYLKGGFGSVDMGAIMACIVLAIIPVIVIYVICQKYIIEGVAAGAVKG
ncbi:ABC transporter, permease protein [Marvinbryantia formatexigens DSM 14469]|uniref:ABC transporter, permease protein n=1 Tax=Marvinbryantia formatexigens DSM 14469 TaxID=478749 RepID=C6L952_9FIRM|nr:carbohydrate ABC transporter permease [Marvinbryantia formatexigens]EET62791.1 ABC transporter, permease protein [Marvinbryantia formatexigens DSM 14469]UWO23144.1 carbohydrate ABC transporter permease [Marvinbryantia formatexigens DSM 14469]SDG01195.1 raffinose/stachyose/melibiose transport system permease protein [Marvinbryantia formatexigens]